MKFINLALGFGVFVLGLAGQKTSAQEGRIPFPSSASPAGGAASAGAGAVPAKSSAETNTTNALDLVVNEAMGKLTSGLVKEAIPLFKKILAVDQKHRKALFGLGTCYAELREYRNAKVVFEKMLEIYPDAFEGLNNLAWLYATATDPVYRDGKKAVFYGQQAVLLAPNSCELWSTLSEAYYVDGQYEKAKRAAAEAVRLGMEKNVPDRVLSEYQRQLEKCSHAAAAVELIE